MGFTYDETAIHSGLAGEINALTEKTTPVDDDLVVIEDSADSNAKKKVKLSNLGGGAETLDDLTDVDTSGVTDGQVLKYDDDTSTWLPANDDTGSGSLPTPSAKGDLAVFDGSDWVILPAGTNDHVLTADSAQSAGLKWAAGGGGGGGGDSGVFWEPSTAGTEDDDFTADSSADWTAVAVTGTVGWALGHRSGLGVMNRGVHATATGMTAGDMDAYLKPLSGLTIGDYIQTAVAHYRTYGSGTIFGCGLVFTNGVTTTSAMAGVSIGSDGNASGLIMRLGGTLTAVTSGNHFLSQMGVGKPLHVRVVYQAANTFRVFASWNGDNWLQVGTDISVTMTPTHGGFVIGAPDNTMGWWPYFHSSV